MITQKRSPSKHSGRKPGPTPCWLNRNALREAMDKKVNNLVNGRWEAVSTPNGIVWFRYKPLLDVLREASNYAPEVMALAVDQNEMNNLLYTVLKSLNDHCVIWGMMGNGYCATKCNVINKKEKTTETVYLTPIKTSWLCVMPSWLERRKCSRLRQAVWKIVPTYGGVE